MIALDIHRENLPARLPPRLVDAHKGDHGNVAILGGAPGMAGAALLAARAALSCGAGRVYAGLLDERIGVDPVVPELMLSTPEPCLQLARPACLVAGPGLGQSGAARGWLQRALAVPHALLLDADALNLLATDADLRILLAERTRHAHSTLLTPHPGEAARLLGCTTTQVQDDRSAALLALSNSTGCLVALKGAGTLLRDLDGRIWRNTSGNPGMAAPGMGDVLCGIIAALTAQGLRLDHAAIVGVWLHGAAGDRAVAEGHGPVGLSASEIIHTARTLLNEMSV